MDPNSDYKLADSKFSFQHEQELFPNQHITIPIQINNIQEDFILNYKIESETFNAYDSFVVMPEAKIQSMNATQYTLIITLFASAIMMVLYVWNRFVYHSYKIDYQKRTHKRPSSLKL